jgi:hypothetical protein
MLIQNDVPTELLMPYCIIVDAGSDASPFVITKLTNFEGGVFYFMEVHNWSTADDYVLDLPLLKFGFRSFKLDDLEQ